MRYIFTLWLLVLCSFSLAEEVTVNYSWEVAYVSDSDANALLGTAVIGTMAFDEVVIDPVDEIKKYKLVSHTASIGGLPITLEPPFDQQEYVAGELGGTNVAGNKNNDMTIINNLHGAGSGDAVIIQTTTNATYLGFDLQALGILFSDSDPARLATAGASKASLDAPFEFIEGRLFLTLGTKNIFISSQGLLVKDITLTDGSKAGAISCPNWDTPDYENSLYKWSSCDVLASIDPTLTDNNQDYIASIRVPEALGVNNKGHLHVFLHPSESGSGIYAKDRSSNQAVYDQIEIHPVNARYGGNTGGDWWVYSGNENGNVQNYNGNQIAATIDYVLNTWPDKVDINKGIHMRGTSLGGAGVMHQAMVLPKYQDKITIVDATIGKMIIPKNDVADVPAWGTPAANPEIFDSVDIRLQYNKVKNIHFSWRGGSNDSLGRFDDEFLDICEQEKISCSAAWLMSGHGITESGYVMDMTIFGGDANTDVTLDAILPVITNNTSNYRGTSGNGRGYHNRGIGWDYANITETATTISIPLRYNAMTGIGAELPDQPNTITFSVTPRHSSVFGFTPGETVDWVFGTQSGSVIVDAEGLATIDLLSLDSGAGYTNLVLTHGTPVVNSGAIDCPVTPNSSTGLRDWYVCDVLSASDPTLNPYGIDLLSSFRVPTALNTNNKGNIHIYMHPDDGGSGVYSTDVSSNQSVYDQIEIHPTEQKYSTSEGGWWGYSGRGLGIPSVNNYNGNVIAATIDYALETWPDKLDINKGIELRGKSLGGAGTFTQALILPKYQDKIVSAYNTIGLMMIPKNHEAQTQASWGTLVESPELYDAADIRINWDKVANIHFTWVGGQNDNYDRFDTEFFDICELRKISCEAAWLQSGHGTTESGYSLDMTQHTDANTKVSLDVVLPVITNNTSNHIGALRGYYNRGIGWDWANITDTISAVTIPLRYTAMTGLGADLPDQPNTATFSVTPRRVTNFVIPPNTAVDWVFGGQSGSAQSDADGLVTINGLTLTSGAGYADLVITQSSFTSVVSAPIVYTRVPRTTGTHSQYLDDGVTLYTSDNWDWLDALPEVSRVTNNINAPGQLVIRDTDGTETIIHDCVGAVKPCVPLDPMPNFDGTKILYTVVESDGLKPPWPENRDWPSVGQLNSSGNEAKMYVYDIATQTSTPLAHIPGTRDVNPIWLQNGKIMFSTDRDGFRVSYIPNYVTKTDKRFRLYTADADGTNAVDISPHELAGGLHPYVMASGKILYSTHWTHNLMAAGSTNGSLNYVGTYDNMWSMAEIDKRGGDYQAKAKGHSYRWSGANGFDATVKAMHFIGQRTNGDACGVNYYRSNNNGLGSILCWPYQGNEIEGPALTFEPTGNYSVATWSTSEDTGARVDPDTNEYLGKLGYPEGDIDNQLVVSWGNGYCTHISPSVPGVPDLIGDRIACDTGIYKTTVIPSTHPSDLALVVNDPEWHEFGARIIKPRVVADPDLSSRSTGDGSCELVSTDVGTTDAGPTKDYDFNNNYFSAAQNGAKMHEIVHSEVVGVKFQKVTPNRLGDPSFKNSYGNVYAELGTAPLLADKSIKVKLPCDTPFVMLGVDVDGRAVTRDQLPQSLRPDEKRVCGGCHRHATPGPAYDVNIDAWSAPALDLTIATPSATFTDDILPLFQSNCQTCHNPNEPTPDDADGVPLYDFTGLVRDYKQLQVPDAYKVVMRPGHTNPVWEFGLQKPYNSKYIHQLYARESLLYWKIANMRADGRTDGQYTDDIDFGADHPTSLTPAEIDMVGDWIESGATE